MFLQSSALAAARVGFDRAFQDGYNTVNAVDLWWQELATMRPSTDRSNLYHLLKLIPRLRQWVGARRLHNLEMADYTLTNLKFEDGFQIPVEDFEDDKLGIWNDAIKGLGRAAALWPNDMIYNAIVAGGSTVCYDGQYFFDTDHPLTVEGSADTTQANLHTSTSLTAANFVTVRQAMIGRLGDDGKPMHITPNLLIVPTALEITAKRIVNAELAGYLANNSSTAPDSNVLKGLAKVLVVPELDANSSTTWYMADTTKGVKPLVFQQRRAPNRIDVLNRPTDPNVFDSSVIKVGCDGRGNAGYSLWHLMDKCTA